MYPPFPKCMVVDPAGSRPPDPGGRSFPAAGCRPRPSHLHAGPGGAPEAHKPTTCTHRRRARSHEAPPLRLAQTSASSQHVHPLELGLPQGADTAPRPSGGRSPHVTEWKPGPRPQTLPPPTPTRRSRTACGGASSATFCTDALHWGPQPRRWEAPCPRCSSKGPVSAGPHSPPGSPPEGWPRAGGLRRSLPHPHHGGRPQAPACDSAGAPGHQALPPRGSGTQPRRAP